MKKIVCMVLPLAAALVACSDDSSGGGNNTNNNRNNNVYRPDSGTNEYRDAATLPDSAIPGPDSAILDAEVPPDSGQATQDGGGTGTGKIGDPCTSPDDCQAPAGLQAECLTNLLNMIELPGGYCTASCTPGDPDPCAPDGVCYGMQMMAYCLKPCTDNSECRQDEGYVCTDPLSAGQTVCATELGGGFGP